mmetsp:Transcript_21592/g.47398  ORF Transcript_21592/g.47398 Transcript_21592/m.47398 type:complete len:245 (+) Transcript_21592:115-849(+)|eukprot:CAMPEP_0118930500 /NCGR_PEP_ID=MMETSP1169-20130426/7164_1 /TAXON_ID=36882 /ORGANISM="Pyramimonas obovata, Strain CCMP722" /LENGTH=244 /DNA_ID=CAMNT_0006872863 /DNA_START=110 /DNA_END=844 /DNA_ORIENTATION=-
MFSRLSRASPRLLQRIAAEAALPWKYPNVTTPTYNFLPWALTQGVREMHTDPRQMYGTTVLCVRKDKQVVIVADGQVTRGSEIVKPNVKKCRTVQDGAVIGAFAGATADAFTLFDRLEAKLEEHPGQLTRAAVELAKNWRNDKYLRKLDAVMIVADEEVALTITGGGDVLEPHDDIIGIGSGGPYALAAARALIDVPGLSALDVAKKAMKVAADICIYTNHNFTLETIPADLKKEWDAKDITPK